MNTEEKMIQTKRRYGYSIIATLVGFIALLFWYYGAYMRALQDFQAKYQQTFGEPSRHPVPKDSLFLAYDPQWFLWAGIVITVIGVASAAHSKSVMNRAESASAPDEEPASA